ncbi:hypothetical protein PoB_005839100, partial [Plakobranchus ocellatus]
IPRTSRQARSQRFPKILGSADVRALLEFESRSSIGLPWTSSAVVCRVPAEFSLLIQGRVYCIYEGQGRRLENSLRHRGNINYHDITIDVTAHSTFQASIVDVLGSDWLFSPESWDLPF